MLAVGIGLCLLAFLSSYLAARKGLVPGLVLVLFWGYAYGILRANVLTPASHFIFDASLAACFLALLMQRVPYEMQRRGKNLNDWITILAGWTILIAILPFQTPLVTMVGLRGNLFMVPVALLAARLGRDSLRILAVWIAGLNLLALGFGIAEYFQGVERYFPYSEVTLIIYRSRDVAGGNLRIPSVFSNAHSYAGSMVATLPLLLGLVGFNGAPPWQRLLAASGVAAALFGVLFANTRTNFVVGGLLMVSFIFLGKMKPSLKMAVGVIVAIVAVVALSNERFQRFRSIEDSSAITDRLAGSVNRSFLEVITEYPMGNGLGGGGTSVPHFLAHQVRRATAVENEYARIALELGVPGLLLWVGFLLWILSCSLKVHRHDPWGPTRRLVGIYLTFNFASSLIGTGMLTAIPGTVFTMLYCGWLATRPSAEELLPEGAAPPAAPAELPTNETQTV